MLTRMCIEATSISQFKPNAKKSRLALGDHLGRIIDANVIGTEVQEIRCGSTGSHPDVHDGTAPYPVANFLECACFGREERGHADVVLGHGASAEGFLVLSIEESPVQAHCVRPRQTVLNRDHIRTLAVPVPSGTRAHAS